MKNLKSTALSCMAALSLVVAGLTLFPAAATAAVSDPYVYNSAGGETTPASGSAPNVTPITLAAAPVRTGHTFTGWTDGSACDSLNGPEPGGLCVDGTALYQAGGTYTLYSDGSVVTFTALWTANSSGGGTTTTSSTTTTTTTTPPIPTITTLSESLPSVTYGNEAVEEFSAVVTAQATAGTVAAAPTGTVTVYSSSTVLCTAPLIAVKNSGTSSCWIRVAQLSAGSYTDIFATYTPASSSAFAASTSPALSPGLLVGRDVTTTKLTESKEYVVQYRETDIAFTARVSADYGATVPGGGKVVVRVGPASCTITLSTHRPCNIHSSTPKPGRYKATATYYGTANLQPSTSKPDRLDITGRPSH